MKIRSTSSAAFFFESGPSDLTIKKCAASSWKEYPGTARGYIQKRREKSKSSQGKFPLAF